MPKNLQEKNDQELYQLYLENNEQAFNEIVFRYQNLMVYFIARYTKDLSIAEDISQDVFVYLLLNKEQYNFNYSLKTYLYMIAKCRALNYLKKEKKIMAWQGEENKDKEQFDLEEMMEQNEEKIILNQAIKQMKSEYQEVIYLSHFQGFKYREIAQIMGKNIGQVKILINRAKKKLKKILEEEGYFYDGETEILK